MVSSLQMMQQPNNYNKLFKMPTANDSSFLEELKKKQALKQSESRITDDIISCYIQKKKLGNSKYSFRVTPKANEQFTEAAKICIDYNIDPGVFVDMAYKRFPNPELFHPKHLTGTALRQHVKENVSDAGELASDTLFSITPEEIYNYQLNMLRTQVARGLAVDEVLDEPGLKFAAWFRILMTPERNEKIINTYRKIALLELNSALREFIASKNLDIKRITGR